MEVLYAIISILFISAVILLMVLLFFRRPRRGRDRYDSGQPRGVRIKKIFDGFEPVTDVQPEDGDINSPFRLLYGGSESMRDTLRDTALYVTITNVRKPEVHVETEIQDDEVLNGEGVTVGRANCHYCMKSRYIDEKGTFIIKRKDDSFIIIAAKDSLNGIKETYGGEKKERIRFKDGRATCFVGPIRFDFTVPGHEACVSDASSLRSRFYSDETLNGDARTCTC